MESLMPISMTTLALTIMTLPLINNLNPNKWYGALSPKTSMKLAFLVSIPPAMVAMKYYNQSVSANPIIQNMTTMTNTTSITINHYSSLFLPFALLITWSVMKNATWYMPKSPNKQKFMKYLLTFMISMSLLLLAGSMFQLLIGWEAIGMMSFLLINWWFARSKANSASLQAIIYNRIGDIGLILLMSTTLMTNASWSLNQITATHTTNTLIMIGLVLAATGKSAQFFMHMWLPAAMEGPTPVSALLHSSTMVVAGVYLLTQLHPLINSNKALSTCLCLGAATSMYAAMSALTQNDIKKIIAFSTSSQLGLMMVAIGINCPQLAIFHMITHATFKATLFLSAGSIIHTMQDEQDIRKMGNLKTTMPITTTCLTTNGYALTGIPFLSGFYSKDAILETMMYSNLNAWALLMTILATTMTSSYTLRMILYVTTNNPRHKTMLSLAEKSTNQTNPILQLSITTIVTGAIMSTSLTTEMLPPTLPAQMKLTPFITIAMGTYMTMELLNTKIQSKHTLYKLTNQLAYYNMTHRLMPKITLKTSQLLTTQLIDLLWLENMAPNMVNTMSTKLSKTTSYQKGLMKGYLMSLLITLLTLLMITLI
uniref:NADH-ubiquinone oxidoreductase chain 5 n=1 Tax=Hydrosaurus amboinensis TaxID=588074 RepID=D6RS45_9SAUR|nr:NADH dehydrogenase subunit 5 [Hydrosaurus amboinensis]BAJ08135.1 NADH dehydrogenase subunit 5 [Hydrosaurus amboinensis]